MLPASSNAFDSFLASFLLQWVVEREDDREPLWPSPPDLVHRPPPVVQGDGPPICQVRLALHRLHLWRERAVEVEVLDLIRV